MKLANGIVSFGFDPETGSLVIETHLERWESAVLELART